MLRYDWYAVVEETPIEQGDFLFDIDIPLVGNLETDMPDVEIERYDAIILTQTCDIPKTDSIVLCPVYEVAEAAKLHQEFGRPAGLENLRKGLFVAFHLLNRCELAPFERDFMIVQFERLFVRPKSAIESHLASQGRRLRLLPPYREHLAQAFARFFMRVGLPIDIPQFR